MVFNSRASKGIHGYNQLHNPAIKGIIAISRDISSRKKLENDLTSALRARDEFVSIAAHEFKTPLISMRLLVEIIEKEYQKFGRLKECRFDHLSNQVNNLIYLADDLFNVSQMRSGQIVYKFEVCDVSVKLYKLLYKLLHNFSAAFSQAKVNIKLRVSEGITAEVDGNRLERVLSNLISNALKYASDSDVEIGLFSRAQDFVFTVSDSGPGIPKGKELVIFEAFKRGTDRGYASGLGLGLFISRQIVHAHSGVISAFNNGNGPGCTFTFTIPITKALIFSRNLIGDSKQWYKHRTFPTLSSFQ